MVILSWVACQPDCPPVPDPGEPPCEACNRQLTDNAIELSELAINGAHKYHSSTYEMKVAELVERLGEPQQVYTVPYDRFSRELPDQDFVDDTATYYRYDGLVYEIKSETAYFKELVMRGSNHFMYRGVRLDKDFSYYDIKEVIGGAMALAEGRHRRPFTGYVPVRVKQKSSIFGYPKMMSFHFASGQLIRITMVDMYVE